METDYSRTKPQLRGDLSSLRTGLFLPLSIELEDYCNGEVDVKEMSRRMKLALTLFQDEEFQQAILMNIKSFIIKYCQLNDIKGIDGNALLTDLFLALAEDSETIKLYIQIYAEKARRFQQIN